MSDNVSRPEMVIAIDFGMTCTGVGYCNVATGQKTVRWIQRWPGRAGGLVDKVPTLLVYPKNSTTPSSWGFLSETSTEQMSDDKECKEWFKTFLDEERLQQAQRSSESKDLYPASIEEVERLYCDFFRFLYQTIQQTLQGQLANRWEDANIEFIFSVPTTWKPVPTVERFRSVIRRAGFGEHPNHKADIGLTEAEAAAVHTAREYPKIFNERDVLLVCDVGGGTTDLSVLRVTNTSGIDSVSLEQIDTVQGATIGSVQLDTAFEDSARKRLEMADRTRPTGFRSGELDDIAWQMAKSQEYQNAKCEYGSTDEKSTLFFYVPKFHRGYVNENAGIREGGQMAFSRDEIRGYFDTQIIKLFELIDTQLNRLQQKFPHEKVAHLVISGGLGNSAYVQKRLQERYSFGNSGFPNTASLQVRVAPEPQLVVCKGIVANRVQELSGKPILQWRCSRASYGTMCKVLYSADNPKHFGQRTEKDPLDGKLYIPNCITWFIKEGEPVSLDSPIVRQFTRKCSPASQFNPNPARIFPTSVVSSNMDKEMLPLIMNSSCEKICDISSDFSSLPLTMFKLKNRHWWNSGKKYHRIEYVVKVALGPADIRFELWHNGQKLSKDNSIKVDWHAADPPPERPVKNEYTQPEQQYMSAPTNGTLNGGQW